MSWSSHRFPNSSPCRWCTRNHRCSSLSPPNPRHCADVVPSNICSRYMHQADVNTDVQVRSHARILSVLSRWARRSIHPAPSPLSATSFSANVLPCTCFQSKEQRAPHIGGTQYGVPFVLGSGNRCCITFHHIWDICPIQTCSRIFAIVPTQHANMLQCFTIEQSSPGSTLDFDCFQFASLFFLIYIFFTFFFPRNKFVPIFSTVVHTGKLQPVLLWSEKPVSLQSGEGV